MNVFALEIVHEYIIRELDTFVSTLSLKRSCSAVTTKGKRCTQVVKSKNPSVVLCKKHELCKNVRLVQERQKQQWVIYHNHPPNQSSRMCPRCNMDSVKEAACNG